MTILSLQQFIQQQARELQDPASQEVLTMTVRDLLDAVATNYEGDSTVEVTLDSPEPNSISVKFFPLEDETDEPEREESER